MLKKKMPVKGHPPKTDLEKDMTEVMKKNAVDSMTAKFKPKRKK